MKEKDLFLEQEQKKKIKKFVLINGFANEGRLAGLFGTNRGKADYLCQHRPSNEISINLLSVWLYFIYYGFIYLFEFFL